jgi:hypothetical protein
MEDFFMNIDDIKNDKELVRKLGSIHKALTKAMDDDYDVNKFSYLEHEVNITHNHQAINQGIAFNRVKKIKALMELSENWDNFKTLYKDDVVLKKIGVEFLNGKFEFNQEILKAIKEAPHKNEVQYYFKKGEQVDLGAVKPEDYIRIKEQILPSIENEAKIHLEQKKELIKSVRKISDDTSLLYTDKLNENHPIKLEENATLNVPYGQEIGKILEQIKKGNFQAQQHSNVIMAELPISGIKMEGSLPVSSPSILLKLNMDNYKDYSIEIGSLQKLNNTIQDRVEAIRKKAWSNPIHIGNSPNPFQ